MNRGTSSVAKRSGTARDSKEVRSVVGMRRWLRLTARKHSVAKSSVNDSSRAAADALAAMLGGSDKAG